MKRTGYHSSLIVSRLILPVGFYWVACGGAFSQGDAPLPGDFTGPKELIEWVEDWRKDRHSPDPVNANELFVFQTQWHQTTPPQQCESPLIVHNQEDLDSLSGVSVLNCDLFLDNLGDLDYSPLQSLRRIEGDLEIYGMPFTSLEVFENLEHVGGHLEIGGHLWICYTPPGCYFDPYSPRTYISRENSFLRTLSGLDSLASVGGHIWIQNNPAL